MLRLYLNFYEFKNFQEIATKLSTKIVLPCIRCLVRWLGTRPRPRLFPTLSLFFFFFFGLACCAFQSESVNLKIILKWSLNVLKIKKIALIKIDSRKKKTGRRTKQTNTTTSDVLWDLFLKCICCWLQPQMHAIVVTPPYWHQHAFSLDNLNEVD